MSKKREIRRPVAVKPRRYVPPPCGSCTAHRPEGNYSEVYSGPWVAGDIVTRYIRCRWCGERFKSVSVVTREQRDQAFAEL